MELLDRHLATELSDLMKTFRLVVLGGARQTGKTTLVRELLELHPATRLSFDDEPTLQAADTDPVGLVHLLPRPVVVDEFVRLKEQLRGRCQLALRAK